MDSQTNLTASNYTTKPLKRTKTYFWNVRACNGGTCGAWSVFRSFKVGAAP